MTPVKKTKAQSVNKEVLLAELDLHKVEFEGLRQGISQSLEAERQYLYLSLVAFGAGLGLAPYISDQKAYVILLIFPLVFHVLLWEMLKSIQSIGNMVTYLITTIIPRVNTILDVLGRETQEVRVWGWEEHLHSRPLRISRLITLSFTPTRHWIPILSVGALLIVYALMTQSNNYAPSNGELGLVAVNLFLLVWAGIQNVIMARSFSRAIKREN
jgi:hypothetical protein